LSSANKDLGDITDDILREENPQADAVNALIKSRPRVSGEPSEIELKTDLTSDEVRIHTALDCIGNILEMPKEKFNGSCILSDIVHRKERKALSLNRKSRGEIVNVARNPDQIVDGGQPQEGFIKRFFSSRRPQQ
jgi:hypothetical protein